MNSNLLADLDYAKSILYNTYLRTKDLLELIEKYRDSSCEDQDVLVALKNMQPALADSVSFLKDIEYKIEHEIYI